jgi:DNA-binding CsgD family transcriptional regulator
MYEEEARAWRKDAIRASKMDAVPGIPHNVLNCLDFSAELCWGEYCSLAWRPPRERIAIEASAISDEGSWHSRKTKERKRDRVYIPDNTLEMEEIRCAVTAILSQREKAVLELRCAGKDYRHIGNVLKLSQERCRQIFNQAMRRMCYVANAYESAADFRVSFYEILKKHYPVEMWRCARSCHTK